MAKVKIYSTPTCLYCLTLKEFLKERKIEFEDINVAQDSQAREKMIKKSGQMGVPVIEIDRKMVIGFDREKIIKLLKI